MSSSDVLVIGYDGSDAAERAVREAGGLLLSGRPALASPGQNRVVLPRELHRDVEELVVADGFPQRDHHRAYVVAGLLERVPRALGHPRDELVQRHPPCLAAAAFAAAPQRPVQRHGSLEIRSFTSPPAMRSASVTRTAWASSSETPAWSATSFRKLPGASVSARGPVCSRAL